MYKEQGKREIFTGKVLKKDFIPVGGKILHINTDKKDTE